MSYRNYLCLLSHCPHSSQSSEEKNKEKKKKKVAFIKADLEYHTVIKYKLCKSAMLW